MANGSWRIARNRGGAPIPLILAGIFAVLLLIAGRIHFVPFERARAALSDRTAPLLARLNAPVVGVTRWFGGIGHFFDVYSENQRLREENARLLQWRGAALAFQDRVNHYERLLKTVPDPSYSAVTARVIARSSQPFLDTLVLNAGRQNGVKPGQAVVDARGMLGRVYVAGQHTSWVIVLDDLNSRIPVQVRPGNVQAILAGNNASEPTLEALPQRAQLKNDAEVVTSSDGGLLPAGLPVGALVLNGGEARVALYADAASAEDVRVLDFNAAVEPMPKPSDQDLPAPAKLEPPATTSVAEETVTAKPAPAAPPKAPVHVRTVPRTTAAASGPVHTKVTHLRPEPPPAATDQEPAREPAPDDQTDDQDNQ
jgi:rod shape-determining protein MreC